MATRKRSARRAPGGSAKRSSGTRKRGSASRTKSGIGAVFRVRETFSRGVVGISLLVAGLFFTAAFLTGRGAFLGEAGFAAVTSFLGLAGAALPPRAARAGLLVLLGSLPRGRPLGAPLIWLATATTLAAYSDGGGLLGSGLYASVHIIGGPIGATL